MKNWPWVIGAVLVMGVVLIMVPVESCNEIVCGSIVSKCLLTESCKCDLKNFTCCKECSICLSDLYSQCCSCVEICPQPNDTNFHNLSLNSQVDDLDDRSIEGLFNALTEEPDPRWIIYTYPNDFSSIYPTFEPKNDQYLQSIDRNSATVPNCTVAFLVQCMSWNKCKQNCISMGASSVRWFHDGCCECVGRTCINYGIKESRCPKCNELEELDDLTEDADYGGFDYNSQSLSDM